MSAKSADYAYATKVFDFLRANGIPSFFSQESLPTLSNADYRKEIDTALDHSKHMIVVTSSCENVTSPWVEAEWGMFIGEKRSGRKSGNLVTLLVDLDAGDLPFSLRSFEALPFNQESLDRILGYVK
ncbi:MAG: toll/interleukin-1 receptor domain-containing protein [Candidatus Saccharimonas sp.]|nr:toll/interleukin-1 receptor domain-containing protein [Planctomycetaceae bacterium]